MAYARIETSKRGTIIRNIKFPWGTPTEEVDRIATTLESLITDDRDILKVVTDYTGCDDSDTLAQAIDLENVLAHSSNQARKY